MIRTVLAIVLVSLLSSIATECGAVKTENPSAGKSRSVPESTAAQEPTESSYQAVVVYTDRGQFVISMKSPEAPETVKNFTGLAESGFYANLKFHRLEPGVLIQGGDPNGDGTGGPGYTIQREANELTHARGAVAMATMPGEPDSAGSQFYILLGPRPDLDGVDTVFGQVVEGMEVVDQLQVGDEIQWTRVERIP